MMVVAVTLLSVSALSYLFALGLVWMADKHGGTLVIESKAVATPINLFLHLEYRPQDRSEVSADKAESVPPSGSPIESPGNVSPSDTDSQIGGDEN
jgi:hypothetical protein